MDNRPTVEEHVRIGEIEIACGQGLEALVLVPLENHLGAVHTRC